MKPFLSLLLAPALALCGTFSGTVVSLDGTPVVGAVIKSGTDSAVSNPNGAWSVASVTGIASRAGKTIPVTSHLAVEIGRPRLSFAGFDIAGRPVATAAVRNAIPRVAARSAAGSDTLKVYWRGKRLTVLPVPTDTGNVVFKIDTAWKNDAGIPWNPRISYGSLLDTRDRQTYRTVTIGTQTWMAENLNFAVDDGTGSWWYGNSKQDGDRTGRLYSWATTMGLPLACNREICSTQVTARTGACPSGWHVPSNAEWDTLRRVTEAESDIGASRAAHALKSIAGWSDNAGGDDRHGFRILPSGWASTGTFRMADTSTYLRASDEKESDLAWAGNVQANRIVEWIYSYYWYKWQGLSVRCLKDTP